MESLNYNTTLNNNDDDAAHMSDNALATHIHGMKCTKPNNENINRGFDVSQNILIIVPLAANLESIRQRKQ